MWIQLVPDSVEANHDVLRNTKSPQKSFKLLDQSHSKIDQISFFKWRFSYIVTGLQLFEDTYQVRLWFRVCRRAHYEFRLSRFGLYKDNNFHASSYANYYAMPPQTPSSGNLHDKYALCTHTAIILEGYQK